MFLRKFAILRVKGAYSAMAPGAAFSAIAGALLLGACSDNDVPVADPQAVATDIPEDMAEPDQPARVPSDEAGLGTPLEERVATIGLLNKRNNVSQDLELKPGDQRRVGNVIIRLQSCERTAPWELPQETGAFVQVLVAGRGDEADEFSSVFSGWLFKSSPSLNVVEHPVYDVWVKDCAMSFPGEEA